MIDLYLLAASEHDMLLALVEAGMARPDESGELIPILASHNHALDMIGDLVQTPAVMNKDRTEILHPAVMVGFFHANLRLWGEQAQGIVNTLNTVTISPPTTPKRVWA